MERKLRLVTGLTLFGYAASHFIGHAIGIFGLDAMESIGRGVILAPWRTPPGRGALLASILIHGALGLYALFRRRHLRIPAPEAWQLLLGLSIPFFLAPHVIGVRLGASAFDLDDSYPHVLYRIWITETKFRSDLFLLTLVWAHGCLGIHMWLRRRPTYQRLRGYLLAAAVAMPFAAFLGIVNAGWDAATLASRLPEFAAAHSRPAPNSQQAATEQTLDVIAQRIQIGNGALLVLTLLARLARDRLERGSSPLRVSYPDGKVVAAPRGFSVLEVSRWAGVPHASACGGRGRCSTCRVRIVAGGELAPEASAAERETLQRVKAPPGVRLACQLRPVADISVVPLLAVTETKQRARGPQRETHELLVTALFIDLRDSTRLAAGRMPFDALYIVDRYIHEVTAAIEAQGGAVTTVAGDGVMSVFGARSDPVTGARNALRAMGAIWDAIDGVSRSFESELDRPLAFGAGAHTGVAAVSALDFAGRSSLQILGDAGNIAARLEAATKVLNCVCVVSEAVFRIAGASMPASLDREELTVRGIEDRKLPVYLARSREDANFDDPRAEAEPRRRDA
jgi:adenylate cyclase